VSAVLANKNFDLAPSANLPQCRFLSLLNKYRAFVAGFGSGKTFVGCMAQCIHVWEHPRVNQGYFAPTYPLIRDIFYPTIEEVAYGFGLRVEIMESNKEVHFYRGNQYRGTTICRSMDKPNSIIGFNIGNALIDEFDVLEIPKAMQAWRKIIARMRYKKDGLRNGIDITTTPEGFRATHKLFVDDVSARPALATNYGLVQASTYDNEANLPPNYIDSLIEAYTAELAQAYIDGQFVNLTSGTVYRNFDRKRCASDETIRAKEPLFIGMDFNVMKMAATVYVQRPNGWHAVAELKDIFDTPDMVRTIKERWQVLGHRIVVYPDPTGKNRETMDASKSDIALLHQAGFDVRANHSSPAIKDRVNSTNKRFELGKLFVNVRACPTVANCLERQAYDDNGEPDKKAGFDHQNDATSYPIVYEFPIAHNRVKLAVIHGV
jgi:Terminase large subunit, T4likevirus-type, N-terminal/Terminase RNaseH-like domain